MYKLTLRVDDQLRQYLQDIFHATDFERNEVLQLMMYFGSRSEEYLDFVRNYLNSSPPLSLEEGLGTWILAKKTQERIEGEECRHAPLFGGNTRGKTVEGNRVLPRKDFRSERETSRPSREIHNRGGRTGNGGRLPITSTATNTIKINF